MKHLKYRRRRRGSRFLEPQARRSGYVRMHSPLNHPSPGGGVMGAGIRQQGSQMMPAQDVLSKGQDLFLLLMDSYEKRGNSGLGLKFVHS